MEAHNVSDHTHNVTTINFGSFDPIDYVATVVNCLITFIGVSLNGLVALVLFSYPKNPFDIVQLNQCCGILLEALIAIPLFFGGRFYANNPSDSRILYMWNMILFSADWFFQVIIVNRCTIFFIIPSNGATRDIWGE